MFKKSMETESNFIITIASTLIAIAFIFVACPTSYAATLYMSPTGTNGTTCGTTDSPCATFDYVFSSRMKGGDTLIIKAGEYNQKIVRPPSGSAGAYTIIKAENDGVAILTNTTTGSMLNITGNYIQIEGIKFVGNSATGELEGAYVPGSYNKILRSGFVVTPCVSCYNKANVTISGNYNLVEDCWAWGGGRYKFNIYGGDAVGTGSYNILRRVVVRHDREQSGGFNPQAAIVNYQGSNNIFQNVLTLNSDQISYYDNTWRGPFFLEKGQKGGSVNISGSIALAFSGTWISDSASGNDADPMYTAGNLTVSNSVAYGGHTAFSGSYYVRSLVRNTMSLDHSAVGAIDGMTGFAEVGAGAGFCGGVNSANNYAEATNNILTGIVAGNYGTGYALWNVRGANNHNSFYGNTNNYGGSSTVGANDMINVNPLTASFRYPTRIETGSPLKGAGSDGSDIGPTILKRIGVSGTLYGETGYNALTSENLWPWPNEARIKADMSSYPSNWPAGNLPSPLRGFTAGTSKDGSPQTLTKYVWEYLGNTIPSTVYGVADTTPPIITAFTLPVTSSSLYVPITAFSASDASAVAGYCTTFINSSAGCIWTVSAPTSISFAATGSQTAYAFVRDAAGNISNSMSDTVVITLPDSTNPTITSFTLPTSATSLNVPITSFSASDNVGVTGYLVSESSAPPVIDAVGWSTSAPSTMVFSSAGTKTAYAWAKDSIGNLSNGVGRSVTISISDTTAPVVSAFTMPAIATSLVVPITTFTASDNVGVTGFLVTESSAIPSAVAVGWSASAPTSYGFTSTGSKILYAWAKDAGNNVSSALSSSFTISMSQTGNTYYVRPDGHDSASGFSNNSNTTSGAWLTLQKAANTVVAGDTVYVADGTYAGFYMETSGTSSLPITFKTLGTGANISTRNSRTADGINVESWNGTPADYIVIDGFNVYNQTRMGIRAIAGTGIIIKNCIVHNNVNTGIFSGDTPYIQVLNNTVYLNGSSNTQHNIYISNSLSDNPVIRGNTVYSANAGNGIQLNGDFESGGDGYIDNAIIESNIIYSNRQKGFSLISIRYGRIQNNIIYNNGTSAGGIHLVEQGSTYYSINNVVANNTIDEPNIAAVRINAYNTGNLVFNNVALGSNGIVFEGSGNYQSNNSTSTSGFVNRAGHDYHLVAGSPAINSGLTSYQAAVPPAVDMIGTARPQNSLVDAGAYEYISAVDSTLPIISTFTIPSTSTTLAVPITSLVATDNVGVTGYLVTENTATPVAGDSGWTTSAPTSFTFSSAGSKTAYAWAKDAAGNVSLSRSTTVTIILPDTTAPVVNVFTMPLVANSLTVAVLTYTATDVVGVTGYLITESATTPAASATGWTASAPTSFTFSSVGSNTAYAWAKDAAGNVSSSSSVSVSIDTVAPMVSIGVRKDITAVSGMLSVTATASDNVGVSRVELYINGVHVSTATSAPYAFNWDSSAATTGSYTLMSRSYDAAGNSGQSASIKISVPSCKFR